MELDIKRVSKSPVHNEGKGIDQNYFGRYSDFLLGFIGNQPFSTLSFCSKISRMLHMQEHPITPSVGLTMLLSTRRLAMMKAMPASANAHQHLVPK